jgi:hypothetical protein
MPIAIVSKFSCTTEESVCPLVCLCILLHIDNSDNRRFQKRVRGSPKQKRDFSRYLVQKRESTSHKCFRNGSSDVINKTFPSKISRQKCSDTLGHTILDDFLNVSKKELLFPEFDLMVSNEKEGVTELVA